MAKQFCCEVERSQRSIADRRSASRADHLTDGPGKLAQALGITGDQDGTHVLTGTVRIDLGDAVSIRFIGSTPRIGITKEVDRPWRFVLGTQY